MGWRGLIAAVVIGLIAALAGPVSAQSLTLADVSKAYEAGDLATLERATKDVALLGSLEALDPDALIGVQLTVARRLEDDVAAEAAYNRAIGTIARLRGAEDVSLAAPLRELAEVQLRVGSQAAAIASLERALTIMSAAFGDDHELVAPYRAAYEAALGRPAGSGTRAAGKPKLPYHLVEIFYATHRVASGSPVPAAFYSGRAGPLRYGRAMVSLPNDREVGELPKANIFALEFKPDPARHVILTGVKPYSDRAAFFAGVTQRVANARRKEVFVFVHGFNTSFQGAAERTAQLADDLAVDGAPILYSWPSKGNPLAYGDDELEARNASQLQDLANFLADVAQTTGATRVNLVAHSMGNRFLTRALARLADRPPASRPHFDEIVLAAPDVGVDEFKGLWPKIKPMGRRYTLYASTRDKALQLSGQIHQMARMGDGSAAPLPFLEAVDTTAASDGLLGHADFAGTALDDFRGVIWASLSPNKRCVLQSRPGSTTWVFTGASCPANEFRSTLAFVRTSETPAAALARVRSALAVAAPDARQRLQHIERQLMAISGTQ